MSNVDDVDAFLYGDAAPARDASKKEHSPEVKDDEVPVPVSAQTGDSSDGESSSDDDEDLEVILEPGNKEAAGAQVVGESTDAVAGGNKADGQERKEKGDMQSMLADNAERMDILSVPLLNNLDMFTIDIDMLDEKPWRQPGADITDYFNFGFSEEAWKLYCVKQQDLRTKFNMNKMMPHMMMMQMGNPGMYPNMYPPGMMPQHMRPGQQGAPPTGEAGARDEEGGGKDGDDAKAHMTPQQLQFQQQQQMRMGMPPGFFPPGMRGMPMNQQQMANLPPQLQMQMQMQMQQMNGRPPMPQNTQGAHQRPGPNPNFMGRGPPQGQNPDHRDSDRGSESGRSSRRHVSRERSSSRRPQRGWEGERSKSRPRADRERDRPRGRESSSRAEHEKSGAADSRRSSDRRRERSDRGRDHDRDRDRSERSTNKRRRSVSKDQEPKSASRRRH
ncbi:cleavage polyadenylation factor subunit fip1 [Coemansia sp. D1744]|nr:cleavage polyadenylation factor subunit fip1 [Coemansia sp. D1744]